MSKKHRLSADQAIKDIINHYHHEFDLPKLWGTGESVAADGTLTDNLLKRKPPSFCIFFRYSLRSAAHGWYNNFDC
jgi:hypothetical protein